MFKRVKSKRLEPIRGIIAETLDKLGLAGQLREYRAVSLWNSVVGERIAKHTEAYTTDRGVLIVFVDSHAWLQELSFLKPDIVKKLNAELGGDVITDIRFSLTSRRKS